MAWNTPGSGSGGNDNNQRNPWKPRNNGDPLEKLRAQLRNAFNGGWWRWAVAVLVVLVLFNSFTLIGEQERGVVLRFGQFSRIMQRGPNYKWPWPIESVYKVNATEINSINKVVSVLTSDENIVNVTFNVQYRINDPYLYYFGTGNAVKVLEQTAQGAVREQVGRSVLDDVLNNRGPLMVAVKERLKQSLDAYRTGLEVTVLTLPDARPPEEVKSAFDEVNSAQQVRQRLINEAQAYAAKVVPEARGAAASRRTEAEGYKTALIAKAEGDASRFSLLYPQYKAAPEVTRKRLWLETVQRVLAQNRKVVGGNERQMIYVPMPAPAGTAAAPAATAPEVTLPAVESVPSLRDATRTPRPAGREGTPQ
jgi:membrane protease subunit HflK